jgi:hypothetical protein
MGDNLKKMAIFELCVLLKIKGGGIPPPAFACNMKQFWWLYRFIML